MGIFRQIFLMSCISVGTISATFRKELYSRELNELLYGSLDKYWEYASKIDYEPENLKLQPLDKMFPDIILGAPPEDVEAVMVSEKSFANLTRRIGMEAAHNHPIISAEKMADANGVWMAWFTFNRARFWENDGFIGTGVTLIKHNVGIKDAEDDKDSFLWINWTIQDFENLKKSHLWAAAFEFLVHSRWHIYRAFKQRQPYRKDIRYKMGYLFYRVRRLLYDMFRVLNAAVRQDIDDEFWVDLNGLLVLYEKFRRLDVDMVDTLEMVKVMHNNPNITSFW